MTRTDALPPLAPASPGERLLVPGLAILTFVLFLVSLGMGRVPVPLIEAAWSLMAKDPSTAALVLGEIRLPRAILAVLVGASLGLAGAAMQALLRNPLAEPGILGVSSTAALTAVCVFYFGFAGWSPLALPVAGTAGALIAVAAVGALSGRDSSILTLILAGAAINALAGALTALALSLSPSPYAAVEVVFWLLGSLADRSFDQVWSVLPPMVLGWLLILGTGTGCDALTLGEDGARSLGIDLRSLRLRIMLGSALAVGAAVAAAGVIGFVGLVVPHLLRPVVGHSPRRLLVPSALGGAALLLAADIVVRADILVDRLATGSEIRIGVVTAIIGAPFFLWLLMHTRRSMR